MPSNGSCTEKATSRTPWSMSFASLSSVPTVMSWRARMPTPKLYGMGTTLTMAYSVGTDLFVAHAGDSRAYLYRDGQLERITSDHTLVQVLVDVGAITPEDAREHPRRHVVTNVVGGPNVGVQVEVHRRSLTDGDILLLCTDGLTEYVPDPEIAEILAQFEDPEQAAHRLIDVVLSRAAKDNVTVALARFTIS